MEQLCANCRTPRTESTCGICSSPLCRKCRIFLPEDSFTLTSDSLPGDLKHTYYCGACYEEKVEPFKAEYDSTLEQAKLVTVLFEGSKSRVRIVRKAARAAEVKNSKDRDETILKLAFQAAKGGFNSILEVQVSSEKLRNEGWQTSTWRGRGLPAEIVVRE